MASLRQLRSSLRSIKNTKQIMRAMQLVSASKLKRAQGKLLQARLVLEFLDGLLGRVLAVTPELDHALCARRPFDSAQGGVPSAVEGRREGAESAAVILTSDTGLCGSYNTNLIHLAESHLRRDSAKPTHLIYIGKKGHRYFTKRGFPAAESFLDLAGRPDPAKADAIGRSLMQRFLSGQVGSIDLIYSRFMSSMTYQPTIQRWLPIEIQRQETGDRRQGEYIFEPGPERVFEDLLPRWGLAKFQLILLEAFTSEHSARMIAMKNATDNAEKIITDLTMQRNKIRQAAITKEISEIVGTAEALK